MRLKQIQLLWRKSLKTLRASRILLDNGFEEDSISCAYYSIFYSAKAALLVNDIIVTKSHRALRSAFGKYLINTSEIEKEWSQILSRQQDMRIMADYNESFEVDLEDVEIVLDRAERFVKRMGIYLQSKGIQLEEIPEIKETGETSSPVEFDSFEKNGL